MEKNKSNFSKFMLLWTGELISSIGGGLTSFGLGVYVFGKTGSAASMALMLSADPVGAVGKAADRTNIPDPMQMHTGSIDETKIILNTNKIQEKICAKIQYMQDCRLDFFQILNGV